MLHMNTTTNTPTTTEAKLLDAINTGCAYKVEAVFNERDINLARAYSLLHRAAQSVTSRQDDIKYKMEMNATTWNSIGRLHYADTIASQAAEFEREYAKYMIREEIFCEAFMAMYADGDLLVAVVGVARGEMK